VQGSRLKAQAKGRRTEKQRGQRTEAKDRRSIIRLQLTREDGIKKFQELFKRSLKLNRKNWKKAVERVWEYYPDEKMVMSIIPDGDEGLVNKVEKWMLKK